MQTKLTQNGGGLSVVFRNDTPGRTRRKNRHLCPEFFCAVCVRFDQPSAPAFRPPGPRRFYTSRNRVTQFACGALRGSDSRLKSFRGTLANCPPGPRIVPNKTTVVSSPEKKGFAQNIHAGRNPRALPGIVGVPGPGPPCPGNIGFSAMVPGVLCFPPAKTLGFRAETGAVLHAKQGVLLLTGIRHGGQESFGACSARPALRSVKWDPFLWIPLERLQRLTRQLSPSAGRHIHRFPDSAHRHGRSGSVPVRPVRR